MNPADPTDPLSMREQFEAQMHELGDFIREQRNLARLSVRKLSELAGVSNPYLSQIERGLRRPSAQILKDIARALRISAETLYIRAGILEERDEEDDITLAILRSAHLTEDQKQAMLQIYESFVAKNRSPEEGAGAQ